MLRSHRRRCAVHAPPAMRKFKTLKTSWFVSAVVAAVIAGEFIRRAIMQALDIRVPAVPVAALCVGLVAAVIALTYDGTD